MRYKSFLCYVAVHLLFFALEAQALDQEITRDVQGLSEMVYNENKTVEASAMIPSDPTIYESYMKNARGYVKIAEEVNGPIDYPVSFSYVWGGRS